MELESTIHGSGGDRYRAEGHEVDEDWCNSQAAKTQGEMEPKDPLYQVLEEVARRRKMKETFLKKRKTQN